MGSIANELITRGWTQGTSERDDGKVCLVGAAAAAHGVLSRNFIDSWWSLPTHVQAALYDVVPAPENEKIRAICEAGRARGEFNSSPVWIFNDHAALFDDVLRVAKEADEILDAS